MIIGNRIIFDLRVVYQKSVSLEEVSFYQREDSTKSGRLSGKLSIDPAKIVNV